MDAYVGDMLRRSSALDSEPSQKPEVIQGDNDNAESNEARNSRLPPQTEPGQSATWQNNASVYCDASTAVILTRRNGVRPNAGNNYAVRPLNYYAAEPAQVNVKVVVISVPRHVGRKDLGAPGANNVRVI